MLLNQKGTIEGEATIARTGPESFYFVTGAPSERRVWDWLTLHCGVPMDSVTLTNETDDIGILCLAGPNARHVLSACTDADVSNDALPWLRCAEISIANVPLLALRLSFTGELAYELHAPNEDLETVWDALWAAGQAHGISAFGSLAIDSLRIEKFYRGGHELANDAGHADVAQERFAAVDKVFVGREAMMKRDPKRRIALLSIEDLDTDALTGEAVFKDGKVVGSITSAAYGHAVGAPLAIAFLDQDARSPGQQLTVSVFGEAKKAQVLPDAPWDPLNARLKT